MLNKHVQTLECLSLEINQNDINDLVLQGLRYCKNLYMLKLYNVIYSDYAYKLVDSLRNLEKLAFGYSHFKRNIDSTYSDVILTEENLNIKTLYICNAIISDFGYISLSIM